MNLNLEIWKRKNEEAIQKIGNRLLNSTQGNLDEVVKPNVEGNQVWLVGGKIYRSLISEIYGHNTGLSDTDYVCGSIHPDFPRFFKGEREKWTITPKKMPGTMYQEGFTLENRSYREAIDLFPIKSLTEHPDFPRDSGGRTLTLRGREIPDCYFRLVPLSIQAIAMDLNTGEIFGDVGLDSIRKKVVRINNENSLYSSASSQKIREEEYIASKANSIGFATEEKLKK